MNHLQDKLEHERNVGEFSRQSWEAIEPFFEEKKAAIYEAFISTPTADVEVLVNLKMQLNVLLGMASYFEEKITSGKLATITLQGERK